MRSYLAEVKRSGGTTIWELLLNIYRRKMEKTS